MKKLILVLLLVIGIAVSPTVAKAANVFTLNDAALLMLWEVYESPINPTSALFYSTTNPAVYGQSMSERVGFVGNLFDTGRNGIPTIPSMPANPYSPFAQIQIGANFWGASGAVGTSGATTAQVIGTALGTAPTNSLAGFDKYALVLENDNNSDWWVNIFLNTGYTDTHWNELDNYYEASWTKIAPHTSVGLSIDLTNVANLTHVTNIGLSVGGNMTNTGNNPSNPDMFHVSASPVPEPSSMLLLGMGILGLFGLGKKKKA